MKTEDQIPANSQSNEHAKEALVEFLHLVFSRGKEELSKRASDSKRALELRSLRKDRLKMFEKLGREVEMLVASGDIKHPGLIRGVERIHELDALIDEVAKSGTK